jgi:hypothetical protein
LRRKFGGNRRAQKKWMSRRFGGKVSIRKALRRSSGRKAGRRSSGRKAGGRGGVRKVSRIRKALRKVRAWIRRKFGGSKKRLASFLRRKFGGNRRAQKKWMSRRFGGKVSIRKALRRSSGRKAGGRGGVRKVSRIRKALRKVRAWIRRKFGGSKKRLASFLRRKFGGNRRAQKKWMSRRFGGKVSIRKALRRSSGRKAGRRSSGRKAGGRGGVRKSGSIGPRVRIVVKKAPKNSRSSQTIRLCTKSEIRKIKGPKPKKCVVVFDMQQALEMSKHSSVLDNALEAAELSFQDESEDLE